MGPERLFESIWNLSTFDKNPNSSGKVPDRKLPFNNLYQTAQLDSVYVLQMDKKYFIYIIFCLWTYNNSRWARLPISRGIGPVRLFHMKFLHTKHV
jgi:hypothetical protein